MAITREKDMIRLKEKIIFDKLRFLLTCLSMGMITIVFLSISHAQESDCKNALEQAEEMFDKKDYSGIFDKFRNCSVNLYKGEKKKRVYEILAESVGQVHKNKKQKKALSTALQKWIDDEWRSIDTVGVISIPDTTRPYYEVLAEACIRVDSTKKAKKIITAFAKLESYVPQTNSTKFKIYFLEAKKKFKAQYDCKNALEQAVERRDLEDHGGVLDKLEPCLGTEIIQKDRAYEILTKSIVEVHDDSAYKKNRYLRIITILEKYPPAAYGAKTDKQLKTKVLNALAESIKRELVRRDSTGAISIADTTGIHYYEMLAEAYIETTKENEARELIKAMALLGRRYEPDFRTRSTDFMDIYHEVKPKSLGWYLKRGGIAVGLGVAGVARVYSVTRGPEQLPGPPGSPDSMLEPDVKNSQTSLWIRGGIGVAAVSTLALLLTKDRRRTGAATLSKTDTVKVRVSKDEIQ